MTATIDQHDASHNGVERHDLVDAVQARRMLADEKNLRIIDVRTGSEFEAAHIPGSYNIPLSTLSEHVDEIADLDHPVLLVCQSGNRARQAQGRLSGAGKVNLHLLDGGMNAWIQAGGDVNRVETKTWAMDRQVRLVAGSLVLAGVAASFFLPKAKLLSAGVASGLVFSAVTDTCAMANLLGKLPYNQGAGCNVDNVLAELRTIS